MPQATAAPDLAAEWCGHLDGYRTVAHLCGRGGASDRWVECVTCDRMYSARWLAELRQAQRSHAGPLASPGPPAPNDHPAHVGAGARERIGSMSVPTSTERPEGEKSSPANKGREAEDLGEGHIQGNLTDDPELRFTATGRAVAKLRLAYTPRIKDDDSGRWADGETEFYTINVWGQQGEHCAEHLQRGDRVVATGRWSKRFWEDREGEQRESVELTAQDIGPSLLFRGAIIKRTQRTKGADDGR